MTIETLLLIKAVLVGTALVVFGLWERLRPASPSPLLVRLGQATAAGWRRLGRNLGLFGLNALLSPLIVVPVTVWAEGFSVGLRPEWWSGPWAFALDILVLDFWIYWWHRANHEIQFLWRFHQVHHLDETLDTTSAVRFHAGEVILSALVRAAVIILLDIPLAPVLLFEGLVLASAIFHHSDATLPPPLERALSRVIITPSIHWVHHHAIRADTDSNYGTIFSFWDPLFRSRSRTARWATMPIGVEGLKDRPFLGLLAAPFRRRRRRGA
ncbi:sterol desaturase family protein [Geminicoccaceae bacterium 1502E]|nr:sterol desaturase family protein [Geminicoccaceae bacterium 1502E]